MATPPLPQLDLLPPPRAKNVLPRSAIPAGDCLCDYCIGKCCRYFSLPLTTPTSWDSFNEIQSYLDHEHTMAYVESGTWYLLVMSLCQYLTTEDRCRIYHDRPKVCREYTAAECEYDDDWIFERVFETAEQIREYAEATLPPRRANAATGDKHRGNRPSLGFSMPIATPTTWDDFDEIRWYLAHSRTRVHTHGDAWSLLVMMQHRSKPTANLAPTGLGPSDEGVEPGDRTAERVFETAEQIWEFAEATLPPRRAKRTKPAIAVIVDAPPGDAPLAP